MSFWKGLGKVGALVAAPFTGGASLAAMPMIDAIGSMATGAAAGSAASRQQNDQQAAQLYQAQINGLLGANRIDLEQRQFGMQAPGYRVGQVGRADLIRNGQDFSMGGPAGSDVQGADRANSWKTSGGLRPSALGDDSKRAAELMAAQHLASLEKGPEQFDKIQLPEAPKLGKGPSLVEQILGGVGLGASVLGGLGAARGKMGGNAPGGIPGASTPPFVPPSAASPNRPNPFAGIRF
jgi:hypothetical protein